MPTRCRYLDRYHFRFQNRFGYSATTTASDTVSATLIVTDFREFWPNAYPTFCALVQVLEQSLCGCLAEFVDMRHTVRDRVFISSPERNRVHAQQQRMVYLTTCFRIIIASLLWLHSLLSPPSTGRKVKDVMAEPPSLPVAQVMLIVVKDISDGTGGGHAPGGVAGVRVEYMGRENSPCPRSTEESGIRRNVAS